MWAISVTDVPRDEVRKALYAEMAELLDGNAEDEWSIAVRESTSLTRAETEAEIRATIDAIEVLVPTVRGERLNVSANGHVTHHDEDVDSAGLAISAVLPGEVIPG